MVAERRVSPDDVCVISSSSQQAFLLENVPCTNISCHGVGRMFHIHWEQSDVGAIPHAVMAVFFDIYEDVSTVWGCHVSTM